MEGQLSRRQFLAGATALGATTLFGNSILAQQTGEAQQLCFLPRISRPRDDQRPNIITLMFDTLRYDHVGFYGNTWIQTPFIDTFAAQAQVFDRAYSGGFPTLLNRAELFTGRFMYTVMSWQDLPDDAVVLADVLNNAGYTTGLVFDTWHLKDKGYFLDRGFQSWEWIRGQEGDRFRAQPRQMPLPASPEKFRSVETLEQHLRNAIGRESEADYPVARTLNGAVKWLEQNMDAGPFYLHIDCFDPHEPWDAPRSYVDLYSPGYTGEEVIYPAYAPPDYLTITELEHMRALYAAEVTFVDRWFGHFLQELDRLDLSDNTVVMLLSDHGLMMGEHNAIGKAWSRGGYYEAYPLYQELVHVPFMVRMPGQPPRRSNALVQPADVMPTVLDLANVGDTGTMHGKSLRQLLEGGSAGVRETAVSGRSLLSSLSTKNRLTVSDGEWTLIHGAAHASSHLYHLPTDPQQQTNLMQFECGRARALHNQLINLLNSVGTPAEYVANWLPQPC